MITLVDRHGRVALRSEILCMPFFHLFDFFDISTLRFQASGDAEIKTVPRHFARANQADRCITLLHCEQRLTP